MDADYKYTQYIVLLTVAIAFQQFGQTAYIPTLHDIHDSFSVPTRLVQYIVSAYLIGLAVSQIFISILSDYLGRRRILLISLTVILLASLSAMLSPGIYTLLASSLVLAIGIGGILPTCSVIVRDVFSGPIMNKLYSLFIAMIGLFGGLGPILGGFISHFWNWRYLFGLEACLSAVLLIWTLSVLSETSLQPKPSLSLRQYLLTVNELRKHPGFFAPALINAFFNSCNNGFGVVTPFLLSNQLNVDTYLIGFLIAAPILVIVLGSTFAGILHRLISGHTMINSVSVIGALGGVFYIVLNWFFPLSIWTLIVPMLIISLCIGVVTPNCLSYALATIETNTGTASAIFILLQMTMGTIMSIVAANIPEQTALPLAILIFAATLLASLTAVMFHQVPTQHETAETS